MRLLLALIAIALTGASCTTNSNPGVSTIAPATGKVVVTGEVAATFTPVEISASKIADHIGITLVENFPCGISLQFPRSFKPGSYEFEDRVKDPFARFYAEYSPDCGKTGIYFSSKGSLTLTQTDGKYSGSFNFTASHNRDEQKTIQVSGSFQDINVP